MAGIKHLIECNCILPQFMDRAVPLFHKFIVFSLFRQDIDPQDEHEPVVQEKFVKCENCSAIHRVFDMCQSEIIVGRETLDCVINIDDIKYTLPERLVAILEKHDVKFHVWEEAKHVIDESLWGNSIILKNDDIDGKRHMKLLKIDGPDRLRIDIRTDDSVLSMDV